METPSIWAGLKSNTDQKLRDTTYLLSYRVVVGTYVPKKNLLDACWAPIVHTESYIDMLLERGTDTHWLGASPKRSFGRAFSTHCTLSHRYVVGARDGHPLAIWAHIWPCWVPVDGANLKSVRTRVEHPKDLPPSLRALVMGFWVMDGCWWMWVLVDVGTRLTCGDHSAWKVLCVVSSNS